MELEVRPEKYYPRPPCSCFVTKLYSERGSKVREYATNLSMPQNTQTKRCVCVGEGGREDCRGGGGEGG